MKPFKIKAWAPGTRGVVVGDNQTVTFAGPASPISLVDEPKRARSYLRDDIMFGPDESWLLSNCVIVS